MEFSLVIVGAHDGSKTEAFINKAARAGKVLLIEPVPFLFDRLAVRYGSNPNIVLRDFAISRNDGEIVFMAPKASANSLLHFGDQLGSLVPGHATAHHHNMAGHIEPIKVRACSFATLVETEEMDSIHTLFTDMEGMDAELLPTFPFSAVTPGRIIFEFKHADGFMRVGRKLAMLLGCLEDRGYRIHILSEENMLAIHQSLAPQE
jgi:FkbM family methyltransferase